MECKDLINLVSEYHSPPKAFICTMRQLLESKTHIAIDIYANNKDKNRVIGWNLVKSAYGLRWTEIISKDDDIPNLKFDFSCDRLIYYNHRTCIWMSR